MRSSRSLFGPFVASGGGLEKTLIDSTNDTTDCINTLSAGSTIDFSFDWVIDNSSTETVGDGFFWGARIYNGVGDIFTAHASAGRHLLTSLCKEEVGCFIGHARRGGRTDEEGDISGT